MPEAETRAADMTLGKLLRTLTIGDWAKVCSAAVVVLGAAVTVGNYLERQSRTDAISVAIEPIAAERDAISSKLKIVTEERDQLRQANGAMETQVDLLRAGLEAEVSFATFSENYINYLAGGGPFAADILADYVCALYRESQTAGKDVAFEPTSVEALVKGDWAVSLEDLEASGFNVALLSELREIHEDGVQRLLPNVSKALNLDVAPTVRRPAISPQVQPQSEGWDKSQTDRMLTSATRQVDANSGRLIKIVTFPGHPPFQMPDVIALRVHGNPECRVH